MLHYKTNIEGMYYPIKQGFHRPNLERGGNLKKVVIVRQAGGTWKRKRQGWGNVNPVTKVIPDKTKYTRKQKRKEEDFND